MSSVRLGWGSAEVKDARLTVSLDGDPPQGWKESFETTVRLLGDGEWGEVKLKNAAVQVSDVTPGTEDKLRHHLESIVTQANAAHEAREREAQAAQADGEHGDGGGDGEPSGPDAEMTGRFRSFAESEERADAEERSA